MSSGDITRTSLIDTVKAQYAAFGRGDTDAIAAITAPEAVWHCGGRKEDFPSFATFRGPQGVRDFFTTTNALRTFTAFDPKQFYADKDTVFVLGDYTMTMTRTGRTFSSDFVHIFTFKDGKLSAFREFLDTAALVDAHRA